MRSAGLCEAKKRSQIKIGGKKKLTDGNPSGEPKEGGKNKKWSARSIQYVSKRRRPAESGTHTFYQMLTSSLKTALNYFFFPFFVVTPIPQTMHPSNILQPFVCVFIMPSLPWYYII